MVEYYAIIGTNSRHAAKRINLKNVMVSERENYEVLNSGW